MQDNKVRILEDACLACLNRAKHCPGDAVRIVNLPSNLETNTTHHYGSVPRPTTHLSLSTHTTATAAVLSDRPPCPSRLGIEP